MTETHFRTCPLCEATCGLAIDVEAGRITRIRGDEDDVFSHGYVCPKGASLEALHTDPDRLKVPMLREGDAWREASWEEAYARIEERLGAIREAHGNNAVAVYLGNPSVHNMSGTFYARPLLKGLGTRNVFSASTVDQMPRHVSTGLLYGSPGLIPVPDLDRTDYLLMLGANPLESNGSVCTAPDFPGRLRAIRKRGGRVVVVDPRLTRTAKLADEHLAIRPGSDAAFLLALVHVVFETDRVALGRAELLVERLDALREAVRPFTPEAVAARTGIAADVTRRIAAELVDAPSAAVYARIGSHTVGFGSLASWTTDVLTLLTGNLDRPGGLMWARAAHARASTDETPGGRGFKMGRWKSRVLDLPEVMGEFPVATLADEIETGGENQVRALITVAGNPALSTPNSGRLERALDRLEFMVSVDPYLNETSRHADVVLPPPSPLERSHYDLALYGLAVRNVANYSPPIFETDQPQEFEILSRLALIAMGKGAGADPGLVDALLLGGVIQDAVGNPASALHGADPQAVEASVADREGPDALLDVLLRSGAYGDRLSLAELEAHPHGIDLGALEPRLPGLLRTEDGRIDLLPEPIAGELARLRIALEEDDADGMVLIGRRHVRSNNSWLHNVPGLMTGKDRCTLCVNPEDAERLGLQEGGAARVRSRVGQLEARVEIDASIRRGVVSLPHGFGHGQAGSRLTVAAQHAGVNSNVLTDEGDLDGLSGTAVLNGIPVEVAPA